MQQNKFVIVLTIALMGCALSVSAGVRSAGYGDGDNREGFHSTSYMRGGAMGTYGMSISNTSSYRHGGVTSSGYGTSYYRSASNPTYQPARTLSGSRSSSSGYGSSFVSRQSGMTRLRTDRTYNSVSGRSYPSGIYQAGSPIRRAPSKPEGEYEGDITTDDTDPGLLYRWDEGEWIPIDEEYIKLEDGKLYYWNGSSWVFGADQADADSPIGDIPWILLLLMVGGYTVTKSVRRKSCEQE